MRTLKALLCLSALAGGLAVSQAQNVYSLNVVGYVNVPAVGSSAGQFTMIANPLKGTTNTIAGLIPTPPEFTTVYKFVGGGFATADYAFGAWTTEAEVMTLNPGEGAIVLAKAPFTTTFVGDVMQGKLTNSFPAGFSIRSSMVPQAGTLTALGLTAAMKDLDTVYQWDTATQSYLDATYFLGSWSRDPEPTLKVGESIWLLTGAAGQWYREFNVQ